MPRANLWSSSVPRVELDQRAREARLTFERVERRLAPPVRKAGFWLRRLLRRCGLGMLGGRLRGSHTRGPISTGRSAHVLRFYRVRSEICRWPSRAPASRKAVIAALAVRA